MKNTKRMEEYLEVIKKFIKENGYSPTIREIGKELELSSPATIYTMLCRMRARGLIDFQDNKQRTIILAKR